jgi:hypothetical protein
VNEHTYRGFKVRTKWGGWQVQEEGGAFWPETYANLNDAMKSIDFTLKQKGE